VARGNYSRIGIARVLFDRAGDPINVERMGIALEPEADYELSSSGGDARTPHRLRWSAAALCDDLHGTFARGPRIAIAISDDLFHWRRKGLAVFHPYKGITFDDVDDKDASVFSALIPDPFGQPAMGSCIGRCSRNPSRGKSEPVRLPGH